jgi:hypothetical protein
MTEYIGRLSQTEEYGMARWARKAISISAGFALAGGLLGIGAGTASAVAPTASPVPATGYSCWYAADTGQSLCVPKGADVVAAVAKADGVKLVLPDGVNIGGVLTSAARQNASLVATPLTSVALSVIYDDASYGGSSYTISAASNATCAQGDSYGFPDLNPIGWYGRVSSYRSYSGCRTVVAAGTNYTGASYGYYVNAPSLGVMNDQAKSWRTAP